MNRIYSIQYLRAVAALAVVFLHTGKRTGESMPEVIHHWLPLGNAGVDLFFVISGFIMWSISRTSESDPAGFLMRRLIRVAPPYWIACLLWIGLVTLIGYEWIEVPASHVIKSLAFVPHYNPTFPEHIWPVLVPGWTLTYEMFFYLVFAATLIVPGQARVAALGVVLLALVVLGLVFNPQAAWLSTYTSPLLLEFLGGCLVAAVWMRAPGGVLRNAVVLTAGVAILLAFGAGVDPDDYLQRTIIYGTAGVLIVSGIVGLGDLIPRLPLLERLGDGSYAIYLFHLLLLMPMAEIWRRLPMIHNGVGAIAFTAVTMVLISVMGMAIYRHVERPMQRSLSQLFLTKSGESRLASR